MADMITAEQLRDLKQEHPGPWSSATSTARRRSRPRATTAAPAPMPSRWSVAAPRPADHLRAGSAPGQVRRGADRAGPDPVARVLPDARAHIGRTIFRQARQGAPGGGRDGPSGVLGAESGDGRRSLSTGRDALRQSQPREGVHRRDGGRDDPSAEEKIVRTRVRSRGRRGVCPNMKKITLEKVLWPWRTCSIGDGARGYGVKARRSLQRMMEIMPD